MIILREKVRFVETDLMGVVHHSNHFRWFEMGRVEYLHRADVSLLDLMEEGIVCPIADVECHYKASARFDDWILIETTLDKLTRARMVFSYRIVREKDGLLLAEGKTQNAFSTPAGKVVRLPQAVFERLQVLAASEGEAACPV